MIENPMTAASSAYFNYYRDTVLYVTIEQQGVELNPSTNTADRRAAGQQPLTRAQTPGVTADA